MRKLLYGGLAMVAGLVCEPAAVSPHLAAGTGPADYRNDPRWHALRSFFEKTGCPARLYSQVFLEAADAYDLDWRLLPSISFLESTGGKAARNNNLFGWDSGKARFETPTAGIHTVAYRLAHSALYKDRELDELLAVYNPKAGYGQRVKSIMRRISPAE